MRIILFSGFLLTIQTYAAEIDTLRLREVESRTTLKGKAFILTTNYETKVDSIVSLIQTGSDLQLFDKTNFGYNDEIHWLIIPVQANHVTADNYLLELQNSHYDRLQAWCYTPNGLTLLGNETGDDLPFASRNYIHRNFVWEILQCGSANFTLIIRIEKRYSSLKLPLYIWKENEFISFYGREDILLGISYGMMMLAGVYSLIVFFYFRRKIYITYTLFIITAILLLATSKGLSFQFLYPNLGGFNSIFNASVARLTTFTILIFTQQFLQTKINVPVLHRLLNYILLIYLISFIASPFLLSFYIRHGLIMLPLMLALNFIGNMLCLLAAVFSFKKQRSIASFYLAAYFAAHFSAMLVIIQEFGWIEEIRFDALQVSALTEILVFSLGLSFLMKKVYDERNELAYQMVKQQKESLSTYLQGVEKERERIAGELHDDIGSRLGNLSRMVSSASHINVSYLEEQIHKITNDVRTISHQLMPPATLADGLAQAVSNLVVEIHSASAVKINLQIFDMPLVLNGEISKQTYRIIQEALNNIIRHSKATEVDLQLFGHGDELVVTIEDNGVGFDPGQATPGIGLSQMKSRAKLLFATLDINSSPGSGSHLLLSVPLLSD
jgi:signal transduction histidine kinase